MLTETIQFSITSEVKRWLETQTSETLKPVHNQAKKLCDELNNAIQGINGACKMLADNSSKEIEKRNMKVYNRARALNKLANLFLDRLKKLRAPEQITYYSLSNYAEETQKVLAVMDVDIKNWFPRISPFFIIDRRKFLTIYEKTKLTCSMLNDFLTKEYVKTKTLEETFQLLNELNDLVHQLAEIGKEKEAIKSEKVPVEIEIADLNKKIDELKSKGPINNLNSVNAEIEVATIELKHAIDHLQKPFIKMQALATSGGGGGITPDELHKLTDYLEKPFEALSSEEKDFPLLKEILQKLSGLISEDKLKLKPEKARKAEQAIEEILKKGSLSKLELRVKELAAQKRQLQNSPVLDEVKQNLTKFQEQSEHLKTRKASIESHEAVKEQLLSSTLAEISSHKIAVEKNVHTALGKKIQLAYSPSRRE